MNESKSQAVFIRDVTGTGYWGESEPGRTHDVRLYETPDGFVAASSIHIVDELFGNDISEVMVFRADADGHATDWNEIGVAYPHGAFAEALADAGYRLIDGK